MQDSPNGQLCAGTTARGSACQRRPMVGSRYCAVHAPERLDTRGGPSTFTDVAAAQIVRVVRAGGRIAAAAESAGVPARTVRRWLEHGTKDGGRYERFRAFRAQVEQARADAENRNVAIVAQAAQTNWQAAAWLLERQWPEHWARPSQRAKPDEGDAPAPAPGDPFAEVDELAARRRRNG